MIDISCERLLSLPEAAATLPGRPHASTLWRWRLRGVKGVRLEAATVGGRVYTSAEALARFSAACTAARSGQQPEPAPVVLPAERRRQIAAVRRILDKAGI